MSCTCSSSKGVASPWCDVHFIDLVGALPLNVRSHMLNIRNEYRVPIRDMYFRWHQTEGDNRFEQFKSLVEADVKVREEGRR